MSRPGAMPTWRDDMPESRSMGPIRELPEVRAPDVNWPTVQSGAKRDFGITNELPDYMNPSAAWQKVFSIPEEAAMTYMLGKRRDAAERSEVRPTSRSEALERAAGEGDAFAARKLARLTGRGRTPAGEAPAAPDTGDRRGWRLSERIAGRRLGPQTLPLRDPAARGPVPPRTTAAQQPARRYSSILSSMPEPSGETRQRTIFDAQREEAVRQRAAQTREQMVSPLVQAKEATERAIGPIIQQAIENMEAGGAAHGEQLRRTVKNSKARTKTFNKSTQKATTEAEEQMQRNVESLRTGTPLPEPKKKRRSPRKTMGDDGPNVSPPTGARPLGEITGSAQQTEWLREAYKANDFDIPDWLK